MKFTKTVLMSLLLIVALAAPAAASGQRRGGARGGQRGGGPGGQMAANFEANAPDVGEAMPEVVVYDADGTPHRFDELLMGHYSVVILGCLT